MGRHGLTDECLILIASYSTLFVAMWLALVDQNQFPCACVICFTKLSTGVPAAASYVIVPTQLIGAGDLSRRTLAARGVSWRVQKRHKGELEQTQSKLPTMRAARGIGELTRSPRCRQGSADNICIYVYIYMKTYIMGMFKTRSY